MGAEDIEDREKRVKRRERKRGKKETEERARKKKLLMDPQLPHRPSFVLPYLSKFFRPQCLADSTHPQGQLAGAVPRGALEKGSSSKKRGGRQKRGPTPQQPILH